MLMSSGAILFSLGVLAEYLGVAVSMAMGRPPYLIVGGSGRRSPEGAPTIPPGAEVTFRG